MLFHPIITPFSAPFLTMILLFVEWVFGNSVILYCSILIFDKKLTSHSEIVKPNLQEKSSFSDHIKWKFLKYEIYKLSVSVSKNLAKTERIIQTNLKIELKLWDKFE